MENKTNKTTQVSEKLTDEGTITTTDAISEKLTELDDAQKASQKMALWLTGIGIVIAILLGIKAHFILAILTAIVTFIVVAFYSLMATSGQDDVKTEIMMLTKENDSDNK